MSSSSSCSLFCSLYGNRNKHFGEGHKLSTLEGLDWQMQLWDWSFDHSGKFFAQIRSYPRIFLVYRYFSCAQEILYPEKIAPITMYRCAKQDFFENSSYPAFLERYVSDSVVFKLNLGLSLNRFFCFSKTSLNSSLGSSHRILKSTTMSWRQQIKRSNDRALYRYIYVIHSFSEIRLSNFLLGKFFFKLMNERKLMQIILGLLLAF